jgi:hypothetical protein
MSLADNMFCEEIIRIVRLFIGADNPTQGAMLLVNKTWCQSLDKKIFKKVFDWNNFKPGLDLFTVNNFEKKNDYVVINKNNLQILIDQVNQSFDNQPKIEECYCTICSFQNGINAYRVDNTCIFRKISCRHSCSKCFCVDKPKPHEMFGYRNESLSFFVDGPSDHRPGIFHHHLNTNLCFKCKFAPLLKYD